MLKLTIAALTLMLTQAVPAFASSNSAALPYYAHPEHGFHEMEYQRATFLATEALQWISMSYDSASVERRDEMVKLLSVNPAIIELLSIRDLYPAAAEDQVRSALALWRLSYPNGAAEIGGTAHVSWNAKKLLTFSHSLIRVAYELAGIPRPRTSGEIVESTIYGPDTFYQGERIRNLREVMKEACEKKSTALDDSKTVPRIFKWARVAIKHSPDFAKHWAEGFLGTSKSCESLTADMMDIVGPHSSPLGATLRRQGQLEGLSIYLAKNFFPNSVDPENTPMVKQLRRLQTVDQLDAQLDEASAVKSALGEPIAPLPLIRLIALTSHNHGLELYLEKAALGLVEDPARAVSLAMETFRGVNHFYGLLARHRREHKAIDPTDILVTAERPYHYWGGALVSCELISRGYESWVSALVSGVLGKVYEDWTGSTGESFSGKSEDVDLHIEGARIWSPKCLSNPK